MTKTYDWMAGQRGNAHLCERGTQIDTPKPVCGATVDGEMSVAGGEHSKCTRCLGMEPQIKRYLEIMKQKT